jgi:hypothetical protein
MMHAKYSRHLAAATGALLGLCGCPSGSDDQNPLFCDDPQFAACGGDITGAWTMTDACVPQPEAGSMYEDHPECDGSLIINTDMAVQASFSEDSSYEITSSASFQITMRIDELCADAAFDGALSNGTLTLEVLCNITEQALTDSSAAEAFTPPTCSIAENACLCQLAGDTPETFTETGTYVTAGTVLTTTPDDPNDEQAGVDYCVDGSVLKLSEPDSEGGDDIVMRLERNR